MGPMNENNTCPVVGNFQSLIKSNFDKAGEFPFLMISWPTYSIRSLKIKFVEFESYSILEEDLTYTFKI